MFYSENRSINKLLFYYYYYYYFYYYYYHHLLVKNIIKYNQPCLLILLFKLRLSLADPGGGAHPPLTAADLRFFNAQNAIFSHFFLRSRLI